MRFTQRVKEDLLTDLVDFVVKRGSVAKPLPDLTASEHD
jgi:hypothetical protein